MFTTLLVFTLSAAAPAVAEPELVHGPIKMTPAQIREYNSKLAPDHPNYIRCVRLSQIGSLVRRRSVCRTNQEWASIEANGNRDARESVEAFQKGWSNSFEPNEAQPGTGN